jgi:glycosyltransferase involved in cell wall biosynthesis
VNRRVLHLTFSRSGGAGRAAERLAHAQQNLGWSADILAAFDSDLRTSPLKSPKHTIAAALDEFVVKKQSFSSLFSLARDWVTSATTIGNDYDVYHLHWTNGLVDLARLDFFAQKPIVWTLHDMNPFTGGCHYSLGCSQFGESCDACPAVKKVFWPQVERRALDKANTYAKWKNLHVVAPSGWLAGEARASRAFAATPISVIALGLDPVFFQPETGGATQPGTKAGEVVMVVVAAQLDSPVKNVGEAVEAFSGARVERPGLRLILVGSGGKEFREVDGVTLAGPQNASSLIALLDGADYLVVPSRADNSPLVAYEAASRGVIPIVRNSTGLPEVVSNLGEGHVYDSLEELSAIMRDTTPRDPAQRQRLRVTTRELSDPESTASEYLALYESML